MKRLLITIFMFLPMLAIAQSDWERPDTKKDNIETSSSTKKKAKKEKSTKAEAVKSTPTTAKSKATLSESDKDYKYLKEGAVPEVDGNIIFTFDVDLPGLSAQQVYDKAYVALDSIAAEPDQIKSGIALVNKKDHSIAAQYSEWMTFKKNFVNLDRSKFNYTIIANCTDGHLALTLSRMTYIYDEGRPTALKTTAEKWIADKVAINKKGTKLLPGSAKFRRATINRKDAIFAKIQRLVK